MKILYFKAETEIKSFFPQGISTFETSRDPTEWKEPRVSAQPSPCFSNNCLHSKVREGSWEGNGGTWKASKAKRTLTQKNLKETYHFNFHAAV